MSATVFRKVSLDRLSSPEQLDELMPVTDPRGWLLLSALGTVLATAVAWGFLGSLPHDVNGVGMLVKSGGVFELFAPASGRVSDVAVRVGDVVTEGQVVARLAQPELTDRLAEAKAVLVTLKRQRDEIVAHGTKDVALQAQLLEQQRASARQAIEAAQQSAQWLAEKVLLQEKLVDEGLLTRQTLLNTHQQLDAARQRITDGGSTLSQISVKELELRNRRQEEARDINIKIEGHERSILEFQHAIKDSTEVVAQHTGRILEIIAEQGVVVAKGTPILTLDLMGRNVKELEAVLYVPSAYGKQVRVGMRAYIAPSTVKREEHGLMLARVTYVSGYPASSKGMLRVLKNDKLVSALAGGDAPYEVHADLVIDEHTVSGYKWSSSQGPPVEIQSGTVATGQITIEARRPIEMVLPLLREHTGL